MNLPSGTTEVGLTVGAQGYALKLTRLPIPSESDESPEAHTITLDASGATLVLNLPPPGRPLDSSAPPCIFLRADADKVSIAGAEPVFVCEFMAQWAGS